MLPQTEEQQKVREKRLKYGYVHVRNYQEELEEFVSNIEEKKIKDIARFAINKWCEWFGIPRGMVMLREKNLLRIAITGVDQTRHEQLIVSAMHFFGNLTGISTYHLDNGTVERVAIEPWYNVYKDLLVAIFEDIEAAPLLELKTEFKIEDIYNYLPKDTPQELITILRESFNQSDINSLIGRCAVYGEEYEIFDIYELSPGLYSEKDLTTSEIADAPSFSGYPIRKTEQEKPQGVHISVIDQEDIELYKYYRSLIPEFVALISTIIDLKNKKATKQDVKDKFSILLNKKAILDSTRANEVINRAEKAEHLAQEESRINEKINAELLLQKQQLNLERQALERLKQKHEQLTAENEAMKKHIKAIENEDSTVVDILKHETDNVLLTIEDNINNPELFKLIQLMSAYLQYKQDGSIEKLLYGTLSIVKTIQNFIKYKQTLAEENIHVSWKFLNPQENDLTLPMGAIGGTIGLFEHFFRNARIAFLKNEEKLKVGSIQKEMWVEIDSLTENGIRVIHFKDNAGGIPDGWAIPRTALQGFSSEQKQLFVAEEENFHAILSGSLEEVTALLQSKGISTEFLAEARPIKEAIFLGWFTTTDDKNIEKHNKGNPLARHIVEYCLNGTLTEEGHYEEGADFVIRYKETTVEQEKNTQPPKDTELPLPDDLPLIKDKTLGIIEDNILFRNKVDKAINEINKAFGSSVKEMLAIVENNKADFLYVDLDLPDGSALDVLESIKRRETAALPMIICSGNIPKWLRERRAEYPFIIDLIDKQNIHNFQSLRNLFYEKMILVTKMQQGSR